MKAGGKCWYPRCREYATQTINGWDTCDKHVGETFEKVAPIVRKKAEQNDKMLR